MGDRLNNSHSGSSHLGTGERHQLWKSLSGRKGKGEEMETFKNIRNRKTMSDDHQVSCPPRGKYEPRIKTEVNARYLSTPDFQVDTVSRQQPDHYNRRLKIHGGSGRWALTENPPNEDTPWFQGHRVPKYVHPKPFNNYGAPGKIQRGPEPKEDAGEFVFRGERRTYTHDDTWNKDMLAKKWARDDEIYKLKPHEEKFCSKVLPNRFPSENGAENFWVPTKSGIVDEESGRVQGDRTKYGLYTGRFDKPGTKARQWILKTKIEGVASEDEEDGRFPELKEDTRPRWGYTGKATMKANDGARATAAAQRNFDVNRPRNTWSCPEMGYYWTYR
jgi:hypothetical protein